MQFTLIFVLILRTVTCLMPCPTNSTVMNAAEYIQDTEEYINIELDSSRNRLIRLELVINTATFSIAMYSLVAGEHSWSDSLICFLQLS